jgi:hypothetical protein
MPTHATPSSSKHNDANADESAPKRNNDGPARRQRLGALVTLIGGTQRTRRVASNATHIRLHDPNLVSWPSEDTATVVRRIWWSLDPGIGVPVGPPSTLCLGYLWHPHTSRWSRAVAVVPELLFKLVDALIRHTQPATGVTPGDRVTAVQPCSSQQHS